MMTNLDRLTESGCGTEKKGRICRSRGGESCAFDGAMIVLQPIADTAHIVHGPIACCGNSWEGRGTLSRKGGLYRMGFTTDMGEMDIVYGGERKLHDAILQTHDKVHPKAIFVYATCVSGLIGEDLESVCRQTEKKLRIPVIPVNAPGFVGPKNLGNRIAGEVLLDHVIGTGTAKNMSDHDINLIGEYNIAGDLWLIEPVLKEAGFRVLSRITGDSTFEEITYAHKARLNAVVCSRALINVAQGMEKKYGIPYVEVSFFGKTEMAKALRAIAEKGMEHGVWDGRTGEAIEEVIKTKERALEKKLLPYRHLRGKKAVLYTGGVKSWSFISALLDLGIELVAVGTKKSTHEDEEKMRDILGQDAPLVENITPKNLKRLLTERNADILVAGGRNQYLAIKEGYPFVDVNQERHIAYAGYDGLVNLAEQMSNSIHFYEKNKSHKSHTTYVHHNKEAVVMNPLKHSPSIGAAMAFQGIHNALPIIHGAQGCTFLAKVLLTKHFREPIALASTKLFAEDVVMGSDENLSKAVKGFVEKDGPDVIGILTSGLTEIKGDDVAASVRELNANPSGTRVVFVSTPDYEGGIEAGYCAAVSSLLSIADAPRHAREVTRGQINVLAGPHLTPADCIELREVTESFGLRPIILPDLSSLDGSRLEMSPLATGGTEIWDIISVGSSEFTIGIGMSMEPAAQLLKERFGIEYRVCEGISGIKDTDIFLETLGLLSGRPVPLRYERQRRILVDAMGDCHGVFAKKRVCIALEADHALQTSRWITEMGGTIPLSLVPTASRASAHIHADRVIMGDLSSIQGEFDLLISNSHATHTAEKLGMPLLQAGFPVYKIFGNTNKITIGYKGTLSLIQEAATLFAKEVHR
ncbi:MAG TPA: nitrogenase iron-molybdenum cofactor biosynthesis protein NifE [Thermodesulfovibrionales bacterium]|nr:nitrogenase iron-molybdenum cofactor biosynthesis protein NifE [Thermodesulfovibrionales bacterium]